MSAALKPDIATAQAFLNLLDPTGVFTFQTFDDSKGKNMSLARVVHGTLEQHAPALCRLNAQRAGVFVMVNEGDGVVRDGAKTCRTNANVVRVRSLFLDLDGAPLPPVLAARQPDIVVETSPGRWHAYWLGAPCPLADFSAAQVALAQKFSGDASVKDLARVMRLPGFWHQKSKPFMTRTLDLSRAV